MEKRKGRIQVRVRALHLVLLGLYLAVLVWSLIRPRDLLTWALEMTPMLLFLLVLLLTFKRFPFTSLTYVWVWIALLLVTVGAHYTYEHNPWFDWIKQSWGWKRNDYDRFGHFVKGIVVALLARELLVRASPLQGNHPKWLVFLVLNIVLSVAALYELLEFAVAKISGTSADAFLGTQGDVWDSEWDMLMSLLGSVVSLLLWSRWQNRQMWRLPVTRQRG